MNIRLCKLTNLCKFMQFLHSIPAVPQSILLLYRHIFPDFLQLSFVHVQLPQLVVFEKKLAFCSFPFFFLREFEIFALVCMWSLPISVLLQFNQLCNLKFMQHESLCILPVYAN
uniref:Uncharacterized protein n=1 Tax=Neogobius melanostomus TaxID=47308 RepID=A0A8C6TVH9_9GOBI